ncbi:MAG: hypothetical protein F4X98_00535 [Gammaproteobacteria bacterium]|nr:hypothetical protein [Gammaproteobacteria bacterium]
MIGVTGGANVKIKIALTKRDVVHYSARYELYEDVSEDERVARRLSIAAERGHLDLEDLRQVARWKSPRRMSLVEGNGEPDVREASRVSFTAKSERLRIGALRVLEGIEWPRASAILHFVFPEHYPILDVRAMRTVDGPLNSYTFRIWAEYTRLCRQKAAEYGVTLRQLDRALWTFDRAR